MSRTRHPRRAAFADVADARHRYRRHDRWFAKHVRDDDRAPRPAERAADALADDLVTVRIAPAVVPVGARVTTACEVLRGFDAAGRPIVEVIDDPSDAAIGYEGTAHTTIDASGPHLATLADAWPK
jgi:hypothetical protein